MEMFVAPEGTLYFNQVDIPFDEDCEVLAVVDMDMESWGKIFKRVGTI